MKKKTILAVVVVIFLASVGAVIGIPRVLRAKKYEKAVTMVEHELYEDAVGIFSELGDYEESSEYMDYCLMQKAVKDKDYESTGKYAAKIQGFLDADRYRDLSQAHAWYQKTKYDQAITTLRELTDLPGASDLLEEATSMYVSNCSAKIVEQLDAKAWDQVRETAKSSIDFLQDEKLEKKIYELAERYQDWNEWESAETLYDVLGDYENSRFNKLICDDQVLLMKYQNACYYLKNNSYDEAEEVFEELGDYEDSRYLMLISVNNRKEEKYRDAVNAFEEGKPDAAEVIFKELSGFRESDLYLWRIEKERSQKE